MSYQDSIQFKELYKAAGQCANGVRWKDSVQDFLRHRLSRTLRLYNELKNDTYRISKYSRFVITEPKVRNIVSTRFRDRIIQKSMCNNGLYEQFTKGFIHDSAACQNGKGTSFLRNRLKCHLTRYWNKHGSEGWVLKLDIRNFFGSITHCVAKKAVKKRIKDEGFRRRVYEIIDSFDDPGIGLGSQISQLIALSVLDDMDHFIKERLKMTYYVRYMDDMIIIHHDKEILKNAWREIESMLNGIGLELNRKSNMIPLSCGFVMLKRHYRYGKTGRIVITPIRESINRERRKLLGIYRLWKSGRLDDDDINNHFKAWKASLIGTNSKSLQKRIREYAIGIFNKEK